MTLRHGAARYEITVENPDGFERGIANATLDGTLLGGWPLRLALEDDGAMHRILVRLGPRAPLPVPVTLPVVADA